METHRLCGIEEAATFLKEQQGKKVALLAHTRPDGDTVGSCAALYHILVHTGAQAICLCDSELPERLQFIAEGVPFFCALPEEYEPETVIAADIADFSLLGKLASNFENKVDLKLDHHLRSDSYAVLNYVDSEASSCGEIVGKIAEILFEEIPAEIAMPIFAAISSDSGCFKYSCTRPETHRIASLLCGKIDAAQINERLHCLRTYSEMMAKKVALENLVFSPEKDVVLVCFTNERKQSCGASDDELGGIVSDLKEIRGVRMAMVLKQLSDRFDSYRVSVRTDSTCNASDFCERFGGGGHARAAGCTVIAETPEQAIRILYDAAVLYCAFHP